MPRDLSFYFCLPERQSSLAHQPKTRSITGEILDLSDKATQILTRQIYAAHIKRNFRAASRDLALSG
jgi:hypothetical protein